MKKPTATGGIRDRITPLADLPETGIKILLYGRSKTGKTTIAASSPKPILLLSFETGSAGGSKSLNKEGIDFIQVRTKADLTELINDVVPDYPTVIVDTVSQMESMLLAEILGLEKLPEQKSWGMATREQYGECGLQTKTFCRFLLDLPNNTWFLGQERASEPKEDSELVRPSVCVDLQPKTAGWLNAAVDYIGNTFIRRQVEQITNTVGGKKMVSERFTGGIEYCLRVGPDPTYVTGFRKPKNIILPDVLVDPDYKSIKDLIEGKPVGKKN